MSLASLNNSTAFRAAKAIARLLPPAHLASAEDACRAAELSDEFGDIFDRVCTTLSLAGVTALRPNAEAARAALAAEIERSFGGAPLPADAKAGA